MEADGLFGKAAEFCQERRKEKDWDEEDEKVVQVVKRDQDEEEEEEEDIKYLKLEEGGERDGEGVELKTESQRSL